MRSITRRILSSTLIASALIGLGLSLPSIGKAGLGTEIFTKTQPNTTETMITFPGYAQFFTGPVIEHQSDFDIECGVRSGAPNYDVGTYNGSVVITDLTDVEKYKCVTWIKGDLTIDPNWSSPGLAILPWLHAVSGDLNLTARNIRVEFRMPRLYYVSGEIDLDGEWGNTLWRSRSLINHYGTLFAHSRYGADMHGFDYLVDLGRLELWAPDNADPNTAFTAIWKGLAALEVIGSLDINTDDGAVAPGFLGNLDEVEGNVTIDTDQAIYGLSNLRVIGGKLDVYVYDAWKVAYANGLESLEEVGGDFIWDDGGSTLHGLAGLSNLHTVGGDFELPLAVHTLAGLEALTEVGGDLTLTGGIDWGQDLSPLSSLETVGGTLTVEDFAISSLNGLQGLWSVGGLVIHDNPTLSSVSALYGMTVTNNGNVTITNNYPLTNCSANSLVSQIQATGWSGSANVSGNQNCFIYYYRWNFGR